MKRPTTARNTLPAKPRSPRTGPRGLAEDVLPRSILPPTARAALPAALCVAAWCLLAVAGARAGDSSEPAYSTGKKGHQLKWLPYRPTVPKVDPNVRPAAHVPEPPAAYAHPEQPAAEEEVPRTAARPPAVPAPDSPFNDPFGDRDAEAASPHAGSLAQQGTVLPPIGPPGSLDGGLPPVGDDRFRLDEPSRMQGPSPARELEPPADDALPLPRAVQGDASEEEEPLSSEPPPPDETPQRTRRQDLDDLDRDTIPERADITLKCSSPEDFRPVTDISTNITPEGELPDECPLTDKIFDLEVPRPWCPLTFTWKASGLCHKPLYFEQVHLERYGHSWGPYLQPFVSGAHFFLTVPILPYKMGLYPPGECMYTLGYYRPGNCAPYMLDPIPLSVRAGLAQAGAWLGGIYVIP